MRRIHTRYQHTLGNNPKHDEAPSVKHASSPNDAGREKERTNEKELDTTMGFERCYYKDPFLVASVARDSWIGIRYC